MLGVGWTEMLLIGVVALIVIGPKELPSVMHRVGKFAGTIRKMGQDFQRELNKTTGLNEIRNLRESVTQPLKATADAIRKEFNTTTPTGEVKPSGALKPADPKSESVVDEIKAKAGLAPIAAAPVTPVKATPPAAPAEAKAPVKAKRPPRIKAPTESKVETADIEPAKPARMPRAVKAVESPAPAEAVAAAKPKVSRRPAARPAPADVRPAARVKPAAPRKTGAPAAVAEKAPAARKPRKPAADKSTD